MEACESLYQHSCEFIFSVHEYVLVRDKYIIEYHQCLLASELLVSKVYISPFFKLSGIAGLPAVYHVKTLCIAGTCKAYCIVLIVFSHCLSRHYNMPVRVDRTCLVTFCTTYYDSIRSSFLDSEEHIRIILSVRCF